MSKEFYNCEAVNGETTMQMFLKYCPDSLVHLFDLCIVKPDTEEQVQGTTYFDFFLFNSGSVNHGDSELQLIDNLINFGKERFLTHPIFEGKKIHSQLKSQLIFNECVLSDPQ